jgi:hypothetical protein
VELISGNLEIKPDGKIGDYLYRRVLMVIKKPHGTRVNHGAKGAALATKL